MTVLGIGLILVLPVSYMLGSYVGWLIGHGQYTPFNWRILVWLPAYDRWNDKWFEGYFNDRYSQ